MGNKLKAAAAIVVLLGAGYFAYVSLSNPNRLSDGVRFVCVATGETYWIPREDVATLPAVNPKTGERTLLPCEEVDGVLRVKSRYEPYLERLGEKNRYVDVATLAVRTDR